MVKKLFSKINEWLEDILRGLLGRMTPDRRVILIVTMLIVFSGLSVYMTVSSIYNFGRDRGEKMRIEQIETLKLRMEQQRDSINRLNNNYNGTGKFE
ncbi:TraL conjugative transposon family protein [Dysgonomonas termitidis]|uniref:TraL conjugative transposon family protein n=1 Tax=Dysgonomonas termitidis TaxID=1516126 RepID=A0ABV9KTY9_9BACT